MTILERLADFYAGWNAGSEHEALLRKARITLFDFFGALLCGHHKGELSQIALQYTLSQGSGDIEVLPTEHQAKAAMAAFYMGFAAHAVEYDDGHRGGTSHPGVAVIPAALAYSYQQKSSFADLLRAIIIGYDVMLRIAVAINPSHLRRGFHTTGTAGCLGAAAATAAMAGFDPEKMTFCISMGGLQSAGLQEMLHSNPSIKPLQAGKAAMAGVISADLVSLGAKAPVSLFEGIHGWFKAMSDQVNPGLAVSDLGKRWEIMNSYTKLYPTCRHCHPAIDIALEFHNEGLDPSTITKMDIYTHSVAISEVGLVFEPENYEAAMFSMPYAVAIALRDGKVGLTELAENLHNPELALLSKKMKIYLSEAMDRVYPVERGCRMEITLSDGSVLVKEVSLPKGEPETQVSDQGYIQKFMDILDNKCKPEDVQRLWDLVVESPIAAVDPQDVTNLVQALNTQLS